MGVCSWIQHPWDPSSRLILMFDPVHVMKTCRNILERSRIKHSSSDTKNCLMFEDQGIFWDFIIQCYEEDQKIGAFRNFYDLTKAVVFVNNFSKMRVNYALKVTALFLVQPANPIKFTKSTKLRD